MSDNELDNLFKEAAKEFQAPSDPSAWQDMARKLDQAAVVTSFWNWKTISSLAIVGVTSIALVLYLSLSYSNPDTIAAADSDLSKAVGKENTESKSAVTDEGNSAEVNSASHQNLKDKNDLTVGESDQSIKADQSKKKDQLKIVDQGKNPAQVKIEDQSKSRSDVKTSDALAVESTNKTQRSSKTKSNSVQSENLTVLQPEPSKQKNLSPQQATSAQNQASVAATSGDNKDEVVNSNKKNSNKKPEQAAPLSAEVAVAAEVSVLGKSLDTKNSSSSATEGTSNQSISNTKATNLQGEKSATNIDSLKKEEEKKELATSTLISKTEEKPEEQKEKSELMNRFAIKLAISPDYSTVKSATPNSLGINYGVLLEYKLSERWSVATGGIWSKKIYSANDVEYNGYNADWVDGDCRMWDIPVNVYYYFPSSKQFSFYASVGLSSYLMKEENYVYYVESSYGTYDYAMQIKDENNEWFKTLNVSAGMQFRMNKIFSLQFEPTLKAPLAGVGEGEVSLVSLGAFLNLRFDLPLNKRGRNED